MASNVCSMALEISPILLQPQSLRVQAKSLKASIVLTPNGIAETVVDGDDVVYIK